MALPKFAISGSIYDIPGSVSAGELVQVALAKTRVLFFSNLADDKFVAFQGDLYKPVVKVTAQVDEDGTIVKNGAALKLLANDDDLSVSGIQWTGKVLLPVPGPMKVIQFGPFLAPLDGDTLNLGSIIAVAPADPEEDEDGILDGGPL